MSLKKPWRFEGWEITPSYIVLPTERQMYFCEKDGKLKSFHPMQSAKKRSEVEQLLK